MTEVIDFPSEREREWQAYARTVRDALNQTNESAPLINHVLKRMRRAFDEFHFDYPQHFNLPKNEASNVLFQLNSFSIALQLHHSRLLQSRLQVEVELARAQGY